MPSVIEVLRQFLPAYQKEFAHSMTPDQHRAVWAILHCRTPVMGGHLHACDDCHTREFRFHSCNHRNCPQCGKNDTAEWVDSQLKKRVGAPYFMVTFTLPEELRSLFFSIHAKAAYDLLFAAASRTLHEVLANPKWLGASSAGFTMVLHTWNQRLLPHIHLHTIIPGAGLSADGRVVQVKNANFLVPQPVLRKRFRSLFREQHEKLMTRLGELGESSLPTVNPTVWDREWGVHLQAFGDGQNIIKYLGRYVCRTAIGDSRIVSYTDTHVTFRYKDRASGGIERTETLTGIEFVRRYLKHVLPKGMRSIRQYGYCHPAAKKSRERIAFHTGCPLFIADREATKGDVLQSESHPLCPCCKKEMKLRFRLLPAWQLACHPPPILPRSRAS